MPQQTKDSEQAFPPGSVVWAHLKSYPKWPARVCSPAWITSKLLPSRIPPSKRIVMFFNDQDRWTVMNTSRMHAYQLEDWKSHPDWCEEAPGILKAAKDADQYMTAWNQRKPNGAMDHGLLCDTLDLGYPIEDRANLSDHSNTEREHTDGQSMHNQHDAASDGEPSDADSVLNNKKDAHRKNKHPAARPLKAGKTLPHAVQSTAGKTMPLPKKRISAGSIRKQDVNIKKARKEVKASKQKALDVPPLRTKDEVVEDQGLKHGMFDDSLPKSDSVKDHAGDPARPENRKDRSPKNELFESPDEDSNLKQDRVDSPDPKSPTSDSERQSDPSHAKNVDVDRQPAVYHSMTKEELIAKLLSAKETIATLESKLSRQTQGKQKSQKGRKQTEKLTVISDSSHRLPGHGENVDSSNSHALGAHTKTIELSTGGCLSANKTEIVTAETDDRSKPDSCDSKKNTRVEIVSEDAFIGACDKIKSACSAYLEQVASAPVDRSNLHPLESAIYDACQTALQLSVEPAQLRDVLARFGFGKDVVQFVAEIKKLNTDLAKILVSVVTNWMQIVEIEEKEAEGSTSKRKRQVKSEVDDNSSAPELIEHVTAIIRGYVDKLVKVSTSNPSDATKCDDITASLELAIRDRSVAEGEFQSVPYREMAKVMVRKLHRAEKAISGIESENLYSTAWKQLWTSAVSAETFLSVCVHGKQEVSLQGKKRKIEHPE